MCVCVWTAGPRGEVGVQIQECVSKTLTVVKFKVDMKKHSMKRLIILVILYWVFFVLRFILFLMRLD